MMRSFLDWYCLNIDFRMLNLRLFLKTIRAMDNCIKHMDDHFGQQLLIFVSLNLSMVFCNWKFYMFQAKAYPSYCLFLQNGIKKYSIFLVITLICLYIGHKFMCIWIIGELEIFQKVMHLSHTYKKRSFNMKKNKKITSTQKNR